MSHLAVDLVTCSVSAASVLGVALGDRVRVSNLPSNLTGWTYRDGYVLGWQDRISPDRYVVEFDLNPADAAAIGTADDATRSRATAGGVMSLGASVSASDTTLTINTTTAANICTNPGFDTNTTGWSAVNGTLTRDTGTTHTAPGSAKVVATGAGVALLGYSFATTPGTVYNVSAWAYVPAASPSVAIAVGGVGFGTGTTSTGVWQRIWMQFTATQTSHAVQFWGGTTAGNTYYIDDVQIVVHVPLLSTSAGSYPLDLDLNGERVTVTAAPASGVSPQTVTVTRGVAPSVARAHTSGELLDVWHGCRGAY